MFKKINFSFLFALVIGFCSCFSDARDIMPQYKTDQQALYDQINEVVNIKEMFVRASKNEITGERTAKNIDMVLTNAAVTSYTQTQIDSLSKRVAAIAKKNITNIAVFDWVNIIYTRDDGLPISDSTDHRTYVYRPAEL